MAKRKYPGVTKKGDLYKVKSLRKDGVVQNKWLTEKNLKKYDAVFMHYKHKAITAFVPKLKLGKPKQVSILSSSEHTPIKLTIHIKITYDKKHSNRYLAGDRELDLDAKITTECYRDEAQQIARTLETKLKDKLEGAFFENDNELKLFNEPFYETGVVIKPLDDDSIDTSEESTVNYRYSKDQVQKTLSL
jgi:hypothetical protein